MAKTIIGIFPNRGLAQRAVDVMLNYGYKSHDVSIISKEEGEFSFESPAVGAVSDSRFSHAITGALIGAVLGFAIAFFASNTRAINTDAFNRFIGTSSDLGFLILLTVVGALLFGIIGFVTGTRRREIEYSENYSGEDNEVMVAFPIPTEDEGEARRLLRDNGVKSIRVIDTDKYEEPARDYRGYRIAGVKGGKKTIDEDARDYFRD